MKIKGLSKKQISIFVAVIVFVGIIIGGGIYCVVNDQTPADVITDIVSTNDSQIVGKWQNQTNPGISGYEFFEDGTYDNYLTTFSFSGEYEIKGNKLTLKNPQTGKNVVYKINITNDEMTLTLVEEDGKEAQTDEVTEFAKVEHFNLKSFSDILHDLANKADKNDDTTQQAE